VTSDTFSPKRPRTPIHSKRGRRIIRPWPPR